MRWEGAVPSPFGRSSGYGESGSDYVVEYFAARDAVVVIDETGFLKQGKASCGVGRQYTGSGERSRTAR